MPRSLRQGLGATGVTSGGGPSVLAEETVLGKSAVTKRRAAGAFLEHDGYLCPGQGCRGQPPSSWNVRLGDWIED